MRTLKGKMKTRTILLLIPIILFVIFASSLYVNRFQSYPQYERIKFKSAGATLYANLYYPSKNLRFQEQHPLVIYAHGSGWQKDEDIRISLELTKRGFFIASIDYQGHGESESNLLNIDQDTGVLGIAQDCSKLLDAIEKLDIYENKINSSQIGLVGHSLGGLVVLMNAALDPRFSATVSWAGVVNSSFIESEVLEDFNPVNLINETNPKNLLIIHSPDDATVNYEEHALVAQNLTSCEIVAITDYFLSAHYLIAPRVLVKTINWFEEVFFGSETINGPITLTWTTTFILMVFTLISMCLTILAVIIYISKYIIKKPYDETLVEGEKEQRSQRFRKIEFIFSVILFVILWVAVVQLFGLSAIYITPIITIAGYFIFKAVKNFLMDKKGFNRDEFREEIKSQLDIRIILYSISSATIFLGFYYLISLTLPWVLYYPPDIISFFSAFMIFPLYLSTEIIYRKIFFQLSDFIDSRKKRTLFVSIIILFIQLYFVFISFWYYGRPVLIATFFSFLMSSVMNSILYHKTNKFSTIMINSILINGIFFGSTIPVLLELLYLIL